jgi:uncharacterized membrane protein
VRGLTLSLALRLQLLLTMESKAKLAGHPIHPMLVVFPLGLLVSSLIFDIIYFAGYRQHPAFSTISFWNIGFGIIGGLLSAVFGLIDWLGIPKNTRAKRIGLYHGGGNVIVVALFVISWALRASEPDYAVTSGAFVISLIGIAFAVVTGWLGGELVDRLGVGVYDHANLDAPSSLGGGTHTPLRTPIEQPPT